MKHTFRKKTAAVLAAMVLTANITGCGAAVKNVPLDQYGQTVVATLGEEPIYLDEANFYVRYNQWSMEYMYTMYGMSPTPELWSQDSGTGKTAGESTKEDALASLRQERILINHGKTLGITLSEEDQEKIKQTATDLLGQQDSGLIKATNINEESLTRILSNNALASRVWEAMTANIDTNISDEEVRQKAVSYVQVKEVEDGSVDAEAIAKEIADRVKAGEIMEDVASELSQTVSNRTFGPKDFEGTVLGENSKELATNDVTTAYDETAKAWYSIHCTNDNDLDAAESAKTQVITQRKADAFKEAYAPLQLAAPEFKVKKDVWAGITFDKLLFEAPVVEETEPQTSEPETVVPSTTETTAAN